MEANIYRAYGSNKGEKQPAAMSWSRYKNGTNQILKVSTFNKLPFFCSQIESRKNREEIKKKEKKILMLH